MGRLLDLVLGGLIGALAVVVLQRRGRPSGAPARAGDPLALGAGFDVDPNERLPRFADVGGHTALKDELLGTIGVVLRDPESARRYRITWNGVLLHGPPGTGKTFMARALAGELGCNLVEVDTSDLVSAVANSGPGRVEAAFATAARHLPCVLLFDELDAVAGERGDEPGSNDDREVLTQLLQSVEDWRREPRLVVVATTNDLEHLDPAAIRPGRFDRHVRVDLPDQAARTAVLRAALRERPVHPDVDVDRVARRTAGQTPASLAHAVELAALSAFRESAGTGKVVQITDSHLADALEQRGGRDRPTVEEWSWERLVLEPRVLAELRHVQELLEDPEQGERYGIDPPAGLLLTGPPGTGKTTVAKVLAAEAACSFYPVTCADLTSKWVGESERLIARLFRRARANCPSIVFLDEVDAIGATRGHLAATDRQLTQLLVEIDGMASAPGVYVIGATNRPQAVDPALTRGGRLSRRIDLPLPAEHQRRQIIGRITEDMPLVDVDLDALAAATNGYSGADLEALLQQAAVEAMIRDGSTATITEADLRAARSVSAPAPKRRQLRAPRPD